MQINAENTVFSKSHTISIYTDSEKNQTRLPFHVTNNVRWKVYKKVKGIQQSM